MSRFLRKFRWELIPGRRFRKYLIYAIGEIILVVIGILIALQINTWNNNRIQLLKETQYLAQIRDNLTQDINNINFTLEFNVRKEEAIRDAFRLFGNASDMDSLTNGFNILMNTLPNYQIFTSTRTAFDNMLNANSIDLIRDNKLRQALSAYYSNINTEYSSQGRVVLSNRKFVDDISPLLITSEFLNFAMGANLDIQTNKDILIHKDQRTLGNLFQLYMATIGQDGYLYNTRDSVEKLIEQIDTYLLSFE